jgi:6,7-dimethyl-8-ribityllumazine synthase
VELQGTTQGTGCRFGIVVSQFNAEVTEGLLRGARAVLAAAGVADADVSVVRVPGAFEIPLVARKLAESKRIDAVIALGCLIKGDTMHFEYIASATSGGIMEVATATGVPVAFGVLTTLTEEQALARAADDEQNKGREAARAAVEMATLLRRMWQAV